MMGDDGMNDDGIKTNVEPSPALRIVREMG